MSTADSEADRGRTSSWSVVDRIRNGWLPTDDRVFGVNLSQTTVDQKWLYHLESLYCLQILAVDARQIGPELARLGHIPTLSQLKIISPDQGTPLRHLLALQRLEQLQIVNPSGPIDDFVELGKHPTLRELEFEALGPTSKNWAALLEQCRNWPLLEVVRIRSQFALSPGLDALRSCPSLTTLELSAPLTRQDMAVVAGMSQLTDVVLNAKKLEDADLLSLGSLGKIKTLKIYSEGIHGHVLDELRRLLPHCDLDSGP